MPPIADDADWSSRCRDAMACYAAPLLREVAAKLVRPRANQPIDELLDKAVGMLTNPPVIDRRIRDLPEPPRKLLAIIGLSRQMRWKVGHLLALLPALGHDEGFAPIEMALRAGLLYPCSSPNSALLTDFTEWFGGVGMAAAEVFAHPAVAERAAGKNSACRT